MSKDKQGDTVNKLAQASQALVNVLPDDVNDYPDSSLHRMVMDKCKDVREALKEKNDSSDIDKQKEVPQNFDHHIILYAKNWYKKSGDILEDLRTLLCEYGLLEPKYVSDSNIREALANCFAKYAPEYDRGRWIQEMLGWNWFNPFTPRTPEEVMLGALSITEGKYVDPTQLLPVLVKEDK